MSLQSQPYKLSGQNAYATNQGVSITDGGLTTIEINKGAVQAIAETNTVSNVEPSGPKADAKQFANEDLAPAAGYVFATTAELSQHGVWTKFTTNAALNLKLNDVISVPELIATPLRIIEVHNSVTVTVSLRWDDDYTAIEPDVYKVVGTFAEIADFIAMKLNPLCHGLPLPNNNLTAGASCPRSGHRKIHDVKHTRQTQYRTMLYSGAWCPLTGIYAPSQIVRANNFLDMNISGTLPDSQTYDNGYGLQTNFNIRMPGNTNLGSKYEGPGQ